MFIVKQFVGSFCIGYLLALGIVYHLVSIFAHVYACVFYSRHTGSLPIHGDASAKTALYRDRFLLLSQRLSRDKYFMKPAFDSNFSNNRRSCEVPLDASIDYKIFNDVAECLQLCFLCINSIWCFLGGLRCNCMLCCVFQISPIQSLVGQKGRRWVMGVISQLEDGHFYLEDLTASVEINLSNAISFF